eukprot:443142-Rhodomonas_salina.6
MQPRVSTRLASCVPERRPSQTVRNRVGIGFSRTEKLSTVECVSIGLVLCFATEVLGRYGNWLRHIKLVVCFATALFGWYCDWLRQHQAWYRQIRGLGTSLSGQHSTW